MDGVLKYKTLFREWDDPVRHFLYDEQERYLDFVFDKRPFPADLGPGRDRNALRSLECQIMDWADDTAYSLNDLVDSANAGFVTEAKVRRWADEVELAADEAALLEGLLEAIAAGDLERVMNRRIGTFVEACTLVERENFMSDRTHRYRFGVAVDPAIVREQKLYARLARSLVFRSPQVCQLEHKGGWMLERIFTALADNYLHTETPAHALLARDFEAEIARAAGRSAPTGPRHLRLPGGHDRRVRFAYLQAPVRSGLRVHHRSGLNGGPATAGRSADSLVDVPLHITST